MVSFLKYLSPNITAIAMGIRIQSNLYRYDGWEGLTRSSHKEMRIMSKDVIRPLMKAVADLPGHFTGLLLQITNKLRCPDADDVAEKLVEAITPLDNWLGITLYGKPYKLRKGDTMVFRKIDGAMGIISSSGISCFWDNGNDKINDFTKKGNEFFVAFMIARVVGQTHGLTAQHSQRNNQFYHMFQFD